MAFRDSSPTVAADRPDPCSEHCCWLTALWTVYRTTLWACYGGVSTRRVQQINDRALGTMTVSIETVTTMRAHVQQQGRKSLVCFQGITNKCGITTLAFPAHTGVDLAHYYSTPAMLTQAGFIK